MEHYDDRIWTLITKSLTKEATDSEGEELKRWLNEDSEHRDFFKEIQSSWSQEPVDSSFLFDYDSGLDKLRRKLTDVEQRQASSDKKAVPSSRYSRFSPFKIAASILLLVAAVSAFFSIQYWEEPVVTYTTTAVEQRIITLPDGSVVRLNANSLLSFPEHLAGSGREVKLEGEAFFKVAKNPERPFRVHINDAVIRVLGTSFDVKGSSKDKSVWVAVEEGVVSLGRRKGAEAGVARLVHGQLGWLPADTDKVTVEQTNIENYLSWINGRLVFDKMPLKQVIRQLEHIYDIECRLKDSSLASLQLTAYSEKTSLEEVLKMIALSMEITYRKKGNTVTWMRKNGQDFNKNE